MSESMAKYASALSEKVMNRLEAIGILSVEQI
jgi:phosphoribosylaminoimidazole carboxylase (NCAIR synthetase)